MDKTAREDLYRLAALLAEIERIMDPLAGSDSTDFRVDPVPPPPLPPTGSAGGGTLGGGPSAQSAQEWVRLGNRNQTRRSTAVGDFGRIVGEIPPPSTSRSLFAIAAPGSVPPSGSKARAAPAVGIAPPVYETIPSTRLPESTEDKTRTPADAYRIEAGSDSPAPFATPRQGPEDESAESGGRPLADRDDPYQGLVPTPQAHRAAADQRPQLSLSSMDTHVDLHPRPPASAAPTARVHHRDAPPEHPPSLVRQPPAQTTYGTPSATFPPVAASHDQGRGRAEPVAVSHQGGGRLATTTGPPRNAPTPASRFQPPLTTSVPAGSQAPAAQSGRVPVPLPTSAAAERVPALVFSPQAKTGDTSARGSATRRRPPNGPRGYDLPLWSTAQIESQPASTASPPPPLVDIRVPPPAKAFAERKTSSSGAIEASPRNFSTGADTDAEGERGTEAETGKWEEKREWEDTNQFDVRPPLPYWTEWWDNDDVRELSEATRQRIAHLLRGRFLDRAIRRLP